MLRERFSRPLDPGAAALSDSTIEDAALLPHDLWGSLAHARALGTAGILRRATTVRIERGLRAIAADADRGRFRLDPALEDVHLNVEAALTRRIGKDGERLHTGRSRNDQVATDLALYARDALIALELSCDALAEALVAAARRPQGRGIVDGWTHLQPAQRVYWGQLLGTHGLRLARDAERFASIRRRLEHSPLGSGALAGSSLPLDRRTSARWLGFAGPGLSSIDGVSDRDATTETLFGLALLGAHASSLAEELVLGSIPELGRVQLSDAFVTTSSLMPHKRNPDLAELARAEGAPAIGRLVSQLSLLKGLPLGYQRDLQLGKPLLIEGVARGLQLLAVLTRMVAEAEFRVPPAAPAGSTASVELADALVSEGVPFRTAHRRVAQWLVRRGTAGPLSPAEIAAAFPELRRAHYRWPTPTEEPERRRSTGGSAWREVEKLLRDVERRSSEDRKAATRERARLQRLRKKIGAHEPRWLGLAATLRPAR